MRPTLVALVVLALGCTPAPEVTIDCYSVYEFRDGTFDLSQIRATVTPWIGEPYRVVSKDGSYWFSADTWDELSWSEEQPVRTAIRRIENQLAFGVDVEQRWCPRLENPDE